MSKYRASSASEFDRMDGYLDLDRIQQEIVEWEAHNFGNVPSEDPKDGMVEELGELHHHLLKQRQGIRGTFDEHEAEAMDAMGDFMVYAMSFCHKKGWKLSDIIEETWLKVQVRDWITYPKNGLTE